MKIIFSHIIESLAYVEFSYFHLFCWPTINQKKVSGNQFGEETQFNESATTTLN